MDGQTYDGKTEIALFPGDLPKNPDSVFAPDFAPGMLNFLRFRPPENLQHNAEGEPVFPHIRLDRAMDYLLKDWMR